jgi:DHA1 family multidrug resistance protein-like MFS transporter
VTGISALLANTTREGDEGFVYGLDNSVNSGARMVGPMLGVTISGWLGLRMVFGAAALLYLLAGVLAIVGLAPRKQSYNPKSDPERGASRQTTPRRIQSGHP